MGKPKRQQVEEIAQVDIDDVRRRLSEFMQASKTSAGTIARAIGWSPASVSQWMGNTYKGDNNGLAYSVAAYLERMEESERLQSALEGYGTGGTFGGFVETSVARRLMEVATRCHLTGTIGLLVGTSGAGKTTAAREYCRRHPDVIYIDCHHQMSMRDLLLDLHTRLDLKGAGNIHFLLESICAKLDGTKRLIIVDEAEHLHPNTLDQLRKVNDRTGCGVLYVALEQFYYHLQRLGRSPSHEYIVNRVRTPARVDRLSLEDTEAIIRSRDEGLVEYSDVFFRASRQNGRVLVDLIQDTMLTSSRNASPVTEEMIRQVAQFRTMATA